MLTPFIKERLDHKRPVRFRLTDACAAMLIKPLEMLTRFYASSSGSTNHSRQGRALVNTLLGNYHQEGSRDNKVKKNVLIIIIKFFKIKLLTLVVVLNGVYNICIK